MKLNSSAIFYDACAPTPEFVVGVLPPPDMGQEVRHFNVFSISGPARGAHDRPSTDHTGSVEENSATFLLSNLMLQTPNNNQRTWVRLSGRTTGARW